MKLTIEQALQQGIAAHKEGKLQEAERLYRAILQSQPLHPDANHNLGVLAVSVNKVNAALPLFKTALEANPKIEQFWLSYIDASIKDNQPETAKAVLEKGRKAGLAGDKVDALEAQLKQIPQSALLKSPEKKKSPTPKEKRKKIAASKKQKKQTKDKNANSLSPPRAQIDEIVEHYQNGMYDETERLAVTITQEFPEHQFGWKVLGALLKHAGKISESLVPKEKAVELAPQDADAHSNLGNTLQELGRLGEAEESYLRAITLKPDFAEAHSNLGYVLKELNRLNEAEVSCRQAIALKPGYVKAHNNLGVSLHGLGRLDEAEASYTQAIAFQPDFAEAHSNLGNTLQELGRLGEAEESYTRAITLKPDFAEAHSNLGYVLKELNRLNEAEVSCKQAIALKPDFAEAHNNLGVTLQGLGRLDEAEASYTQAISLKPSYSSAHNNLGNTLKELGRRGEAEESYTRAITLKPDFAEAHSNLGSTLHELGRLDEAEASYTLAIALKPDFSGAYYNLGITLQELGRLDDAAASYTQAIALKSDYAEAHSNLGNTLQELGRLEDAEASYTQAIALKPDYAEAYSNLGNTLQELGRLEEAEASCRQAIVLKPNFGEAHSLLGGLMHKKGDVDSALHCFEKAFKSDSNLRFDELRSMVLKSRAAHGWALGNSDAQSKVDSGSKLHSNPLILSRPVEIELIETLYELTSRKFGNTKDARYGNGSCSLNFQLFEEESSIIKIVSSDLNRILSDALKSKVYVHDSFFNILGAGGGSRPHNHINSKDKVMDLWKQKYSLVYYLSVGDQDCSEPGVLKFYSPNEDILPCEGMIVIVPATREHSAIYGGKTDRVMIGVNFYAL